MKRYDDVYLNYFGNVVFVRNTPDFSFMSELRGKRSIDINTQKTFFITSIKEAQKVLSEDKIREFKTLCNKEQQNL